MRINKYLSSIGFSSRREADRLIKDKKITINGKTASLGDDVLNTDIIKLNNKIIKKEDKKVILLFNKPKGIVCTSEKREKNNIIDYINYPIRIFNIGRLDKDSHGLILLSNIGILSDTLSRARNLHEKEYIVRVNKNITKEFLDKMRNGVYLKELAVTTRKCKVFKTKYNEFHIILTEGLNRQIRRMCMENGYMVTDLYRIRIMNLKIDNIKEGEYRKITEKEKDILFKNLNLKGLDNK